LEVGILPSLHNYEFDGKYNANMRLRVPLNLKAGRLLNLLGWTRSSSVLLAGFLLTCALIAYIWWPLAREALVTVDWHGPWWLTFDWLLVGIFAFMSLTIITHASLARDTLIVFVGMVGGLVIETWGTQTNLWHYYTTERPPLWIIPAWPIASLCIDRIYRFLNRTMFSFEKKSWNAPADKFPDALEPWSGLFKILYWTIFPSFLLLMLYFVAPTIHQSHTILALLLVIIFIATPTDHRYAVLTFAAGTLLGYFLERWGTTRQCWTYYTAQTPPLFAVLAHGMAAVAFWRAGLLTRSVSRKLLEPIRRWRQTRN
jgi:hypothetical protein